jgi:hypothetical protein
MCRKASSSRAGTNQTQTGINMKTASSLLLALLLSLNISGQPGEFLLHDNWKAKRAASVLYNTLI